MKQIKWEAEATALSGRVELEKFVFKNPCVDNFINNEYGFKPFIIACKGMGKTLLLHYRRHICEGEKEGAAFLPATHRKVEFPEEIRLEIKKETIAKLGEFDFCKRFWGLTLRLYVLSGLKKSVDDILKNVCTADKRKFKELINGIFSSDQKSLSYIVNSLLGLSYGTLFSAIDILSNDIKPIFDDIHTPVCVFLDQLDQAFADVHKPIWITMQNALMEAAWDIGRVNNHIKIYLSIRKEAYVYLGKQTKNAEAMQSSIVQIEYSKDDLKLMIDHLVQYYEKKNTLYDFFGGNHTFDNIVTFDKEDVFDFMFRYSIGRPRDFVLMCYGISSLNLAKLSKKKQKNEIKRSICKTAGNKIIDSLFEEQKMILGCFESLEDFKTFLQLLEKNVYTYNEVVDICKSYNKESCNYDCKECGAKHHPFCDLYNMGLLGIIEKEYDAMEQRFKTPYEGPILGLIKSDYYLIHPALREYIKSHNRNYDLIKGILVGHKVPWEKEYADYHLLDIALRRIPSDVKRLYEKPLEQMLKNKKGRIKKPFDMDLPDRKVSKSQYHGKLIEAINNYISGREKMDIPKLKIFISYASDDLTDVVVNSLRTELRSCGYEAEHFKSIVSTKRNLDELMRTGIEESDKVIVVLSELYKNKILKEPQSGVKREYSMILNDIEVNPNKYILVCFDKFDKGKMYPTDLGNKWVITEIRKRKNFNTLISFINDVSEYSQDISDSIISVEQVESVPFFDD